MQVFGSLGLELASCHSHRILQATASEKAPADSKAGKWRGGMTASHCEPMGAIVKISLPHLSTTFANFEKSLYLLINASAIRDVHIAITILVKS